MRHRSDGNKKDVVAALRKIGARVDVIERPVDLLVTYRRRIWAIEIKNPETGYGLSEDQEQFLALAGTSGAVVKDADDAIRLVTK